MDSIAATGEYSLYFALVGIPDNISRRETHAQILITDVFAFLESHTDFWNKNFIAFIWMFMAIYQSFLRSLERREDLDFMDA